MIKLGEVQELQVKELVSKGAYLVSTKDNSNDKILLPIKEVPENTNIGDKIKVFVYNNSKNTIISTTEIPKITLNNIALLKVVDTTRIGAFLDWGLEKDLFLPFTEQRGKIRKGKEVMVGLYIDKSNRLCATMDVYSILESKSPYKRDDIIKGTVYNFNREIGVFIAVDDKYHGLIPRERVFQNYKLGDRIEARISKVRDDGKLELSVKKKAYKQMDIDAEKIVNKLKEKGGVLNLNDKSSPDKIQGELNMSKSSFKRAVGRLLKKRIIKFNKNGIEFKEKE